MVHFQKSVVQKQRPDDGLPVRSYVTQLVQGLHCSEIGWLDDDLDWNARRAEIGSLADLCRSVFGVVEDQQSAVCRSYPSEGLMSEHSPVATIECNFHQHPAAHK